MIRPAILTFLRKGKMICQKVYPTLIDTWNYVVSRVDNIKGDQDVNAAEGWITVDNTKPTHPVIRFDSSKLQPLSSSILSGEVFVDSETAPDQRSIDWLQLSSFPELSSDSKALQLYNFDLSTQTTVDLNNEITSFDDLPSNYKEGNTGLEIYCRGLSDDLEFVCREGKEVKYYQPILNLPPIAVPDSVVTGGRERSMEYGGIGSKTVVRPWGWQNPDTFTLSAEVSAAGGTASFVPISNPYSQAIIDAKVLCRTENVDGFDLRYADLKVKVTMPDLAALNNLSVVTGIEYPMTGTNQYKIVAHRKKFSIVNNVLQVTDIADQTIDTVAHDSIYPNN